MGFLKNMTIKRVTKKRFNQLMGLIENDLPIGSNSPVDPMKTLMGYIEAVKSSGETIEVPPDITHWWDLFVYLVCIMVLSELAYDPTMASEQDFDLIIETVNIQLEKWKRESVLKKFARRNMIISMGDKFLKGP
jgi:hypothetical protein